MKHVFVTLDEPASLAAMSNYHGTRLMYNDGDFAFWHCTDLAQDDIDEIHGNGVAQEVRLVGMLLLNKPQQPTVPVPGIVDAIPL